MVMQALEAGGVALVSSGIRDSQMNEAMADVHYRPNPKGLYEIPVPVQAAAGFPQQYAGKALKVLLPPFGPATTMWLGDYFIIVMRRNMEEIRQSFEAFFAPKGVKWPLKSSDVAQGVFDSGVALLTARTDAAVTVWDYRDVLSDPVKFFSAVPGIDGLAAASMVVSDQCRFRVENLVVGA